MALFKLLAFPLSSLFILTLGTGFFITFVSIRLSLAGASDAMVGFVTAIFYTGVLLASILAPRWIAKIGHLRTWILLCIANSLVTLAHALWVHLIYWTFLRFLAGIILGGFFIVIESLILLLSPASKRGQTLSIYILLYYLATSAGQFFLNLNNPFSSIPYWLTAVLSAMAIVPNLIHSSKIPINKLTQPFSLKIIRTSFKGFLGGFSSGMLLACIYGLAPLYGQKIGLSIPEIGTLMAIVVCGGLALQWPLGKWSDLTSRRGVMNFVCFAGAIFSASIAIFSNASWPFKLLFMWLFGGFSFALYPLSMAYTCEKIQVHQVIALTGGFNLVYGLGAIGGPLLAPLFMVWFGSGGLFYFLAAVCFAMGIIGSMPHRQARVAH